MLRAATALALPAVLALLVGMPICSTPVCPMSAEQREICEAMGRDCCATRGGQLAHGPSVPVPVLAFVPVAAALPAPLSGAESAHPAADPFAAPAVVQGVGLFVLFAVFLI